MKVNDRVAHWTPSTGQMPIVYIVAFLLGVSFLSIYTVYSIFEYVWMTQKHGQSKSEWTQTNGWNVWCWVHVNVKHKCKTAGIQCAAVQFNSSIGTLKTQTYPFDHVNERN